MFFFPKVKMQHTRYLKPQPKNVPGDSSRDLFILWLEDHFTFSKGRLTSPSPNLAPAESPEFHGIFWNLHQFRILLNSFSLHTISTKGFCQDGDFWMTTSGLVHPCVFCWFGGLILFTILSESILNAVLAQGRGKEPPGFQTNHCLGCHMGPEERSLFRWSDMGKWHKKFGFPGVITLLIGVITPYTTGRGPPSTSLFLYKSVTGFLFNTYKWRSEVASTYNWVFGHTWYHSKMMQLIVFWRYALCSFRDTWGILYLYGHL